ncbi:DUF21 domain-containing protein [Leptobacterium flavescens]|uniref:DUF21 domain-containing protein n=1 Tax=Leptobacterium flavescens TaxID=472055 RepID=A0A6P0UJH4_9FLAO|nr:hemolysin family protein [Leptobacterium flavescens]NER13137.1 DUF21 domain-containing protein [Leptobacterium flavescens]
MTLLIIYALVSIFFSFLCSILEAVLLSVTPTFVSIKKQEGKTYATALEALKKDVDKPLIAILTLNTIAHTVGAILVGATAGKLYGNDSFEVTVISGVMTFLILTASEIIPKTIGATYWKQLTGFTTRALQAIIFPLKYTGILWLLQLTTKLIGKSGHGSVLSKEDFTAMADIAEQEGVFQKSESEVIKNLLKFDEILAKDVMTPRTVMKTSSENTTIKEFFEQNRNLRFSRIPVYKDSPDNITGFVLKDMVLEEMINKNGENPLSSISREILVTSRNIPIPKLFEKFVEQRDHIALVVDEFGSVSGLVTMEDVIETLLGLEIMDESDNVEDLQQLARKNWENRAKRLGIIEDEKEEEE